MLNNFNESLINEKEPIRKRMVKKGTISIDIVETTPVVWKGELIRFEAFRGNARDSTQGVDCYRFVNMKDETTTPEFAFDYPFGCCYTENDKMYVFGSRQPQQRQLDCFWSDDLVAWESKTALVFPENIKVLNTSVCKGRDSYIMAIEIGGSNPVVGVPFTCVFARSENLLDWELLPMDTHVYARDRYTACPSIRYYDDYYYMVYLEAMPCHRFVPYIVRSKDLEIFELGIKNPIMWFDDDDKIVQNPERFTQTQLDQIQNAVNCNDSDVDFCDYNGKTVILYSWGNQLGKEYLAEAEYDGTLQEFLTSFFV